MTRQPGSGVASWTKVAVWHGSLIVAVSRGFDRRRLFFSVTRAKPLQASSEIQPDCSHEQKRWESQEAPCAPSKTLHHDAAYCGNA